MQKIKITKKMLFGNSNNNKSNNQKYMDPIVLQISGVIRDGGNGASIADGVIELMETVGSASRVLSGTRSDHSGRYFITHTLGDCIENSLYLNILAEGYLPQQVLSKHDPHIRCTDDIQRIDIELIPD